MKEGLFYEDQNYIELTCIKRNTDGKSFNSCSNGVFAFWNSGVWTAELKRKLDTGYPGDDVVCEAGNTCQVIIAVMKNSGGDQSGEFPVDVKF
ncbi:MAG: hypothetical protein GXO91_00590 [FCB group bacterium]|nr:hypothetical protein [FCB group bacterium]